jgi:flagellar biosynthesis/type III secretory pathway chaperone
MPKDIKERSSNSELVSELMEILKEEASLFEGFLELLEQQQKALVRNDVDGLKAITETQREKVVESRLLAREREAIISRLSAQENGMEDLTVSKLIEFVSTGEARMLGQLRDTILDLNTRVAKVRSQNEILISRSRENIIKTMELLGRIKAPDVNYHSQGEKRAVQTNLALDRRI